MTRQPPRIVLVELGEPGAPPGSPTVAAARALRDAGAEVIYGGTLPDVPAVVRTAEQEDPDVLGVPGAVAAELAAALPGLPVLETGEALLDWLAARPRVAGHTAARRPNDPR